MLRWGGTLEEWVPLKDTQFPIPRGTQPKSVMITNECLLHERAYGAGEDLDDFYIRDYFILYSL